MVISNAFRQAARRRIKQRHQRQVTARRRPIQRRWGSRFQAVVVRRSTRAPVSRQLMYRASNIMGLPNGSSRNIQWMRRQYAGLGGMKRARRPAQGRRSGSTLQTDSSLWRSIGIRLAGPLQPNRNRFDLFDKEYRAQIVRKYILPNGGLAHIGTNLKRAVSDPEIPFPERLGSMFAISIRIARYENLLARLGPWGRHLNHWAGTNGEILDKTRMVNDGIAPARLKRGEIGCYDSHYRLWKHISDNNIPYALILEDDADLNYGHSFVDRINKMFSDIRQHNLVYDVIYLGHNNNKKPKKMVTSCLGTPAGTQGLFMYHVTLEGVRRLLPKAIPITQPVDDYVYAAQHIRQFILEPRISYVVSIERSDTAYII